MSAADAAGRRQSIGPSPASGSTPGPMKVVLASLLTLAGAREAKALPPRSALAEVAPPGTGRAYTAVIGGLAARVHMVAEHHHLRHNGMVNVLTLEGARQGADHVALYRECDTEHPVRLIEAFERTCAAPADADQRKECIAVMADHFAADEWNRPRLERALGDDVTPHLLHFLGGKAFSLDRALQDSDVAQISAGTRHFTGKLLEDGRVLELQCTHIVSAQPEQFKSLPRAEQQRLYNAFERIDKSSGAVLVIPGTLWEQAAQEARTALAQQGKPAVFIDRRKACHDSYRRKGYLVSEVRFEGMEALNATIIATDTPQNRKALEDAGKAHPGLVIPDPRVASPGRQDL